MLICVQGEKTQSPSKKKKHTETEGTTGKKYVVAVRGGGGEKKNQRASQITPSTRPPSSLVEASRERALAPRPDYD